MFSQPMQGQLPFSPTQLQFPVGNYNVVPNIGLEPQLQQFAQLLQPMSQVLIEELQSKCRQSPLRTFLFNQMANNGFQNAEFSGLVKSSIEYFAYLVRRNQVQNPTQGVYAAAQEMVMFIAAQNYRNFPGLQQFEDPNKIQVVLNKLAAITQDISRERTQGMYPGVQQQFGGGMPQGGGFNQFTTMQPGNTNFQQAAGPTNNRNFGGNTSSGIFTSNEPDRSASFDTGNSGMGRNFGTNNTSNIGEVSEQLIQEEILSTLEQTDSSVDIDEANRRWKPSEGNFYRPAYEPSHQKLTATKKNDRFFYQVKELGEFEMDPARHRLTPLFGNNNSMIAEKLKGLDTSVALAEAVSDAKSAASGVDCTLDTYSRIRLDSLPIELGYDSVWVSGIVERIRRSRDRGDTTPINIIQWHSSVVKPIVVEGEDVADTIRRFSTLDSAQLLMAIANKKDTLPPAVLAAIDERLTEATNAVIKTNMSISGLSIESFIDDWKDLVNIISNKYGELIAAKLVSKDEEIIRNALNMLSAECGHDVTMGIYDTADGETYPISYFAENVSFTMLEFFSSELNLDFVSNTSALLSKVNTRVWYDLADQIFREFGDECTRHLIRTCDGKILEIKKGWLTDNAYIINLVG